MGRISIVIDGIDEIVPRLRPRALVTFFESIVKYSNYLGRGKIILTCRDAALVIPRIAVPHDEYEILPFDQDQIEQYYHIRFNDIKVLRERANSFLGDLKLLMSDGILPFVLRVVCDSVEDDRDTHTNSFALNSDILELSRRVDYIIYKVCEREEAKYQYSRYMGRQNSVDVQCSFFLKLAASYHGTCSRDVAKSHFYSYSHEFDDASISPFYNHPLLRSPHIVEFSDDVISEFFLGKALVLTLAGRAAFTISEISDIADKSQVDSQFMREVASHFQSLDISLLLEIENIISQARRKYIDGCQSEEYSRHASAIFNVGLQIICGKAIRDPSTDLMDAATSYLGAIFCAGDTPLQGVALHNIPARSGIQFDFSNLAFERASILNYEGFLLCRFNKETAFRSSRIRTGLSKQSETQRRFGLISERDRPAGSNFVACDVDGTFLQSIAHGPGEQAIFGEDAIRHLESFLRNFRRENSFRKRINAGELETSYVTSTHLKFEETLRICLDCKLLTCYETDVWISDSECDNAESFILERIHRGVIENTIASLLTAMRS